MVMGRLDTRKENMKATRLPSGSYRVRVTINKQTYSFTNKSKKEALKEAGIFLATTTERLVNPTFKDAMEDYISENEKILSAATIKGYVSLQKNLFTKFPAFCNKNIVSINSGDVQKVSLITILAVFLIVMISFRSFWVPLILVCVIQGAVWVNMAFSGLVDGSVFFMCYLICMALQMGATIDYGILMTSHYRECRESLSPLEAAGEAMKRSMQTIFTSGLALITAGFAVGLISSVFYISEIGKMLGRGAIVSVLLVLFLLPQLLIWLDRRVVSGRFSAGNAKYENDG